MRFLPKSFLGEGCRESALVTYTQALFFDCYALTIVAEVLVEIVGAVELSFGRIIFLERSRSILAIYALVMILKS